MLPRPEAVKDYEIQHIVPKRYLYKRKHRLELNFQRILGSPQLVMGFYAEIHVPHKHPIAMGVGLLPRCLDLVTFTRVQESNF